MIPDRSAFRSREWQLIQLLNTPLRVQRWLNELPYNDETRGETLRTFRGVLRTGRAHCLEGALAAAVILSAVGDGLMIGSPTEVIPLSAVAVVCAGPALYLLGHVLYRYRVTGSVSLIRLAGAVACVLVGGLVISEGIFEWPGMGQYFLVSLRDGDYVRVLPWMMIVVLGAIIFNLVADLMLSVLDPRIRYD